MKLLSRPGALLAVFLFSAVLALGGAPAAADDEDDLWAPTPPRLSYVEGEVTFLRQGAEDWVRVRPNLPLAEGDALFSAPRSHAEIQFDDRAFVRLDENTQLTLAARDAGYIQFRVASGLVSVDLRDMKVGDTVEVSTPSAVFVIERAGYYRVEVGATTHFITRRGGSATLTSADGRSLSIYPSEDIVVIPGNPVQVATYAAPAPDRWDRWNDERSERLGDALSARYLPQGIYGSEDLDHYGDWRVVSEYGPVWIPRALAGDWSPYSTGSWIWDPYYEWTWVDDAPWGWAPFHYGRWVRLDGFWAWAPGPVVRRPYYAPALVAFLIHDGYTSARISLTLPGLWWVSLSWGEPVRPWWGHHRHRGQPRWLGWGGPRFPSTSGHFLYRNSSHPRAVLTMPSDKFGREPFRAVADPRFDRNRMRPVLGDLPIPPGRPGMTGGAARGMQPPREVLTRPVISTRMPRERAMPGRDDRPGAQPPVWPEPRLVPPPPRRDAGNTVSPPPRPQFGPPPGQPGGPERSPPPLPPRLGEVGLPAPGPGPLRQREPRAEPAPRMAPPPGFQPARPDQPPREAGRDGRKTLPGQPANRMYMQGQERGSRPGNNWGSR